MMFLVLILVSAATAAESNRLASILRSPQKTLNLYASFKKAQGLTYSSVTEDRARFKLFLGNVQFAAAENDLDLGFELGVNKFSAMTEEESRRYLGFNGTHGRAGQLPRVAPFSDQLPRVAPFSGNKPAIPETKLWTEENLVTAVKDQGPCGSCWTFGAVGGIETRYARLPSSVLRSFAEQEYLDCVYEDQKDGCNGGWMHDCYEYSAENGGRLATTATLPYVHQDRTCNPGADGMVVAKISGHVKVGESEAENIAAIAEGSITIAFEVTKLTQLYKTGILRDTTCVGVSNHAVTAVGYTPVYILVKNSWGSDWGEDGFVRFARNFHNCNSYLDSYYPTFTAATGDAEVDGSGDAAAVYDIDRSDDQFDVDDACLDIKSNCRQSHCASVIVRERYCKRTCGMCEGDCPAGTVLCDDGVCRHEHMC